MGWKLKNVLYLLTSKIQVNPIVTHLSEEAYDCSIGKNFNLERELGE